MASKKPELEQSATVAELPLACYDEASAVDFFERKRWGDCPCCVACGDTNVYKMTGRDGKRNKDFRWRCRGCGKLFTVRMGMVFEESLVPMHKWARAVWESATCKNGVSALELARKVQVSYKTALFMMHRIRHAMGPNPDLPKLSGTVEADETYVGGKPRHSDRPKVRGRSKTKTPVLAVVQRGGDVRATVTGDATSKSIRALLTENVEPGSTFMTDDWKPYRKIAADPGTHKFVRHSYGEYVRYENGVVVHTNTIEGF